jgi:6-phosphogluconolactonase (cycloisomerase 2 family)
MTTWKMLCRSALAVSVALITGCGGGGGGGGGGSGGSSSGGGSGGGTTYPCYLFVANAGTSSGMSSDLYVAGVAADGSLHQVRTYTDQGTYLKKLAASPNGKYLYAVDANYTGSAGSIRGYAVGAGGTLTPLAGSPYATGKDPVDIAIDPTGRFAYVAADGADTVFAYAIGADGALSAKASANATVDLPLGLTFLQAGVQPLATTELLVRSDGLGADALHRFLVADDGALTEVGTPLSIGGGLSASVGNGKFAYLADDSDSLSGFTLHMETLIWKLTRTANSPAAMPAAPRALALTPAADHLYAILQDGVTSPSRLVWLDLDADGGVTGKHAGPAMGTLPMALATHPAGGQLLAAEFDDAAHSPVIRSFPLAADGAVPATPAGTLVFDPYMIGTVPSMLALPSP